MTCRFEHDDAAYVLGALAPSERLDFERHLADCDECTRAVRELAGLPGLLGRVDAVVLEHPPPPDPVPDTMLPRLTRTVRRGARRRTFAAAGLAAAAAASVALISPSVVSRIGPDHASSSQATTSGTAQNAVVNRRMSPVGDVPVEATIGLERVTWGTRLLLTCTYRPRSVEYAVPAEADYTLFVRTREGRTEQVGSWRSVSGAPMHVAAATAAAPADIASVEVRTTDGRVVLRLAA